MRLLLQRLMIQDEIAHWQRSIAELERMVVGRVDVEGEQPAELSPVDSCDLGGRERLRNLNGLLVRSQDGELSSRPNSSTQDGEHKAILLAGVKLVDFGHLSLYMVLLA